MRHYDFTRLTLRGPRITLSTRTGTEGPRHDPYSFEEFIWQDEYGSVILHCGLGTDVYVDRDKVDIPDSVPRKEREIAAWADTEFKRLTGFTRKSFERTLARYERAQWRSMTPEQRVTYGACMEADAQLLAYARG